MSDPAQAGREHPHPVELVGLLHELTAVLIGATDVQQALDRLACFTARAVPRAVRCSVTLVGDGSARTVASSEPALEVLDEIQYETGDGPCLQATRTRTLITCQDLSRDDRWPQLSARATALGVRGVASVPLDVRRNAVGALNIFLPDPDAIGPHLLITGMAVAGQSELLLDEVLRRSAQAEMTAELQTSLRAGATIDHAIGVIVAQRGCGIQEAYEVLHETAQRLNLRPHVIAERLVETAVRRAANTG